METVAQPRQKTRFGVVQLDPGHSDLGKSQLMRPFANLREQAVDVFGTVHLSILGTRSETWPDESACAASAARLALHPGLRDAIVELHGPLGAGKTCFVRALLRSLGVEGRIKSPTYAVMEPYRLPGLDVWHFDFYRFDDPREWEDAGFRELFTQPGLKVCEWPEKAEGLLPVPDLAIHIEPRDDESRLVRFEARSERGVELLA